MSGNSANTAAIVVGVDDYAQSPLEAACDDARNFADAIVRLELVPRENVTLLLSPRDRDTGDRSDGTAERDSIRRALEPLYRESEKCSRLFFYFAGHGLLAHKDAVHARTESAIMPADVKSLSSDGDKVIVLDELLERFDLNGPEEQFWFIDACRDLGYDEPSVGNIGWAAEDPVGERRQAVLWAVPKQGQAIDTGEGFSTMTQHLVTALERAVEFVEDHGRWAVTARSVHRYVQNRVAQQVKKLELWERRLMVPRLDHEEPAVEPIRFVPEPHRQTVTVHVVPEDAAPPVTEIEVGLGGGVAPFEVWPPNSNHATVELLPRVHWLDARAAGRRVRPDRYKLDVRDDPQEVTIMVDDGAAWDAKIPPDQPDAAQVFTPVRPAVPEATQRRVRGGPAGETEWPKGQLSAKADAREIAIEVSGLESPYYEIRELGELRDSLPAGPYRVDFKLGPELLSTAELSVGPGSELRVSQGGRVRERGGAALALAGIAPFSEHEIDADSFSGRPLSVVVSLEGEWREPRATVLERVRVEAGFEHATAEPLDLAHRVASRALTTAPEEPFAVVVESPDVGHIELASASLPNRATVVTLRLRSSGAIDVTHNLLRLPDRSYQNEPNPDIPYAEMVATLQSAQQLYKSGDLGEVRTGRIVDLLYGKWTDPILGCMGFYAGRRQQESFPSLMEEAVHNLAHYFGTVPDVQVVSAIALGDPTRLDQILDQGVLPLLGASTRELAARAEERGDSEHPVVQAARRISRDQPWTMILATRSAPTGVPVSA